MVDDEQPIVEFCRALLEQQGYRVEGFTQTYPALRRFARDPQRYHLAVVDQAMPGLEGRRLIAYLRRKRPDLPCIIISGYYKSLPSKEEQSAGYTYLVKPFSTRDLIRTVAFTCKAAAARN